MSQGLAGAQDAEGKLPESSRCAFGSGRGVLGPMLPRFSYVTTVLCLVVPSACTHGCAAGNEQHFLSCPINMSLPK